MVSSAESSPSSNTFLSNIGNNCGSDNEETLSLLRVLEVEAPSSGSGGWGSSAAPKIWSLVFFRHVWRLIPFFFALACGGIVLAMLITSKNSFDGHLSSSSPKTQSAIDTNSTFFHNLDCFQPNPQPYVPMKHGAATLPVLYLGVPKAGSSSLFHFFLGRKRNASHWRCPDAALLQRKDEASSPEDSKDENLYCGLCIRNAIQRGLPPLASCGNYQYWGQLDYDAGSTPNDPTGCYWPQLDALEQIHEEQPNATFILTFRNMTQWVNSLERWGTQKKGGIALATRLIEHCHLTDGLVDETLEHRSDTASSLLQAMPNFFCQHISRVRKFVAQHPTHSLVELNIEDPNAGDYLARVFGGSSDHWQKYNHLPESP